MEPDPLALVLLPRPPSPLSFAAVKAAYGPALSSIFSTLANRVRNSQEMSRLDIALAWPNIEGPNVTRASLFEEVQKCLGMLYRLICVISARDSIAIDMAGGIDARVILLDQIRSENSDSQKERPSLALQGPMIDLPTLALSGRQWDRVFAIESEGGEALLQKFLKHYDSRPGSPQWPTVQRVIGGVEMVIANRPASYLNSRESSAHHYSVAVGGTFDHLHAGHKLLLTATALAVDPSNDPTPSTQRTVTVGITGEELLINKKYAEVMQSWKERQERVSDFLESIIMFSSLEKADRSIEHISNPGPNGTLVRVKLGQDLIINCVQIADPYGPTITDEAISALVISKETRSGGKAVNDKRSEKYWPTLEIFEVDVLDSSEMEDETWESREEDFQFKISSTEMRRQKVNATKVNL